jgi:hypothetical protein
MHSFLSLSLFRGAALWLLSTLGAALAHAHDPVAHFNDEAVNEPTNVVLTYTTGPFGALVMVLSALSALGFAAAAVWTKQRAHWTSAYCCLLLAGGLFALRSFLATW